jgi:hypothetical protein
MPQGAAIRTLGVQPTLWNWDYLLVPSRYIGDPEVITSSSRPGGATHTLELGLSVSAVMLQYYHIFSKGSVQDNVNFYSVRGVAPSRAMSPAPPITGMTLLIGRASTTAG